RHHRLVGERDAARMRVERLGNRDGEIRRDVTRLAERQVDDQVLDHAPCSASPPKECRPSAGSVGARAAAALIGINSVARAREPARTGAAYFLLPSALNWLR